MKKTFEPIIYAVKSARRFDLAIIIIGSLLITIPIDGQFFDSQHFIRLLASILIIVNFYGIMMVFRRQKTIYYLSLKKLLPSFFAFGAEFAFCFLIVSALSLALDRPSKLAAFIIILTPVVALLIVLQCVFFVWFFPWLARNRWR